MYSKQLLTDNYFITLADELLGITTLAFLTLIGCSKPSPNEAGLRQTDSEYVKAVQTGDVGKVYKLELPEYQARFFLRISKRTQGACSSQIRLLTIDAL